MTNTVAAWKSSYQAAAAELARVGDILGSLPDREMVMLSITLALPDGAIDEVDDLARVLFNGKPYNSGSDNRVASSIIPGRALYVMAKRPPARDVEMERLRARIAELEAGHDAGSDEGELPECSDECAASDGPHLDDCPRRIALDKRFR